MHFQNTLKRLFLATAICAASALAIAGSAFATGSVVTSGTAVIFTAGTGDVNNMTYSWLGATGVQIHDILPITPGYGCTPIDANTVRCGTSTAVLTLGLGDMNDTVWGNGSVPNNPTINGGDGDDLVHGADGKDMINGGNGNDTLHGGAGDDVIDGGLGADYFAPESGFDKLNYTSRTASLFVEVGGSSSGYVGEGDLITSWDSFEVYTLGSNSDQFYGGANNVGMTLAGGTGNDLLYASNFNDSINGGDGNDTMRSYDGDDVMIGGKGADDFHPGFGFDTVSYNMTLGAVTVTVDDIANDGHITADNGRTDNVHSDTEKVIGSGYSDVITGQLGQPTWVESGGGGDTLNLFDGSTDTADCGGGTDTVNGDVVDDVDIATCETRNLS